MSHLLNESPGLSRRTVLAGAILTGGALALGGAAVFGSRGAFAAVASPADFQRLSEFLTGGQPLATGLAARFQAALARRDTSFNDKVQSLQAYVDAAKAPSIDDLLARPDLSEPLRKTITQIVSAWYLGIVGDDDKTELVSYAQALMYRPTQDVLVIPTYGGGPDSWGEKPTPAPTPAPTNEKQAA
ncbi:sugar dehydrogenase complex small subunit [Paucibacter sp. R3-3]|uniref:Sugar dehydrogenase complex small subunit n=1 Tax=Roseateles agri TaxID=3098619 RepID=A0ABU5D9R1_9BURK|nr:sugar dehydrogenase complex small subunit [Paucibacter sp. R3-3]MDY0742999.1 sugar dehydrogenase complex small subunit [Paucibacter sp. R3-3]